MLFDSTHMEESLDIVAEALLNIFHLLQPQKQTTN